VDEELTVITASWERDPDGAQLRSCLEAHLAHERAHERARVLIRLWLALAAVMGAAAVWPVVLGTAWRTAVLAAWAGLAPAVLGFSVAERYWNRRLEEHASRLESEDADRSP
jgi:hypothetical protein